MSKAFQIALVGVVCVGAAVGVVLWVVHGEAGARSGISGPVSGRKLARASDAGRSASKVPVEPAKPTGVFMDPDPLDDGGIAFAQLYTGPIRNPESLVQLRDAVDVRGSLGLKVLGAELDQLHLNDQSPRDQVLYGVKLRKSLGLLLMYEGRFAEAGAMFAKALELGPASALPWKVRTDLTALRGIVALRRGEVANCIECLGPSSCIFPIAPEAAHTVEEGSREAIKQFTAYLDELPGDLRVRWILNLTYMTLGEYPEKVPPQYLIRMDRFQSKLDIGQFHNVASPAGLTKRGPNMAGGSVFDDFTGDGLPDLFTTSLDTVRGASFFVNRGDGRFEDRSEAAGLSDQVFSLNLTRADFDNDGDLDLVLLRGAWDVPMRMSLLKNRGDGTFEDVTIAAGLAEPIASESAAWGDYDDDGFVDLFVCGEYFPPGGAGPDYRPDPRNRCRLYRNQGDGTFKDVAASAGVLDERCAKGSAWGDYDGDGKLDLFVSNMDGPSRLYHNEGGGKFKDAGPSLGVTAEHAFACWFWDYDNDGRLDLFVNEKGNAMAEEVAIAMGEMTGETVHHPRLYKNLGTKGFREVSEEVGLVRAMTPMGCNFGDIDNDGYLDVYLGTGGMAFSYLVPNLMFKNVAGGRFEDVTLSSGTGHLQKGHGVSFADYDGDGDLDLFVEAGGAVPGDASFNPLFQNPGHGRHWLKVKLVGARTNRAALGAKIRAVIVGPDGKTRAIHRTIGNNSSFGGNSLVELIGLLDATRVAELEISWPTSSTMQTFRDIEGGRTIEITEGSDSIRVVPQAGAVKTVAR